MIPSLLAKHYTAFLVFLFLVSGTVTCVPTKATSMPEISSHKTGKTLTFAVVPGAFCGDGDLKEWLGSGTTFDIEKRLERWSCLKGADRLRVRRVLKGASSSAESVQVTALFEQLDVDLVIVVSGSSSRDNLTLEFCMWNNPKLPLLSFRTSGTVEGLFEQYDSAISKITEEIKKVYALPEPDNTVRLHLRPASSTKAFSLMIKGKDALQNGQIQKAGDHLAESLKLDPGCWWSHYFLGAVEFYQCNYSKAVEQCKAAININPDLYAGIYANLSYCCIGLGDTVKADWAKMEFEKRTGETLPLRPLPGSSAMKR